MKKLILGIALCIMAAGVQSCKKDNNQPADQLITGNQPEESAVENSTEDSVRSSAIPHESQEDTMVKDAQSKPLTNLALAENTFDFGDIKKGKSVEHVYKVTNTGTNPLIISAVKPGCGCTAPDYTKDPIMPGKTGNITLKFDSSNFDGQIHKQAEVFANVEKAPIVISFTGNVVP